MANPLAIHFELNTMDAEDILAVLRTLNEIYKDLGGEGLVIKSAEVMTRRNGHRHITRSLDLAGVEVDKIAPNR